MKRLKKVLVGLALVLIILSVIGASVEFYTTKDILVVVKKGFFLTWMCMVAVVSSLGRR